MPIAFAGFDGTGGMDGPSVEKELFGQRRFTGIRVRDNGKGTSLVYFFRICGHSFSKCKRINHGDGIPSHENRALLTYYGANNHIYNDPGEHLMVAFKAVMTLMDWF